MLIRDEAAPAVWVEVVGNTLQQYAAHHGTIVAELQDGYFRAVVAVEHLAQPSSGLNFRWSVFVGGIEEATGCHPLPIFCCERAQAFIRGRRAASTCV